MRTVLIGGRPLARAGLRAQLERHPDVDLVAVAGSLDELPADIPAPDTVVCAGDAQLVAAVRARWPHAEVVTHPPQPSRVGVQAALTARERDVLARAAEGLSNRGIAERLEISEHTVKSHLRWAMTKLEARTRTAAVRGAVLRGLL